MEAALSKAAPDCCFKHVSANFGRYTLKGHYNNHCDFAAFLSKQYLTYEIVPLLVHQLLVQPQDENINK